MNKNNQHLMLHGIPFSIDYTNQRLVQDSYPVNGIPFGAFEHKNGFLTGQLQPLDMETTPSSGTPGTLLKMPASLLTTKWEHTPEHAAAFNAESYAENWNVLLFDEAITRRLNGTLPVVDIAGVPFVVDWQLRELRAQTDYFSRIDLDKLTRSEDDEYYTGYFHIPSGQMIEHSPQVTALPKDTVWVQIPCELYLDPIGVARECDMHETFLLTDFPVRENQKATVKQPEEKEQAAKNTPDLNR